MSPAASESPKSLSAVSFSTEDGVPIIVDKWLAIIVDLRDSGLAEIFLGENVGSYLGP